MDDEITFDKYIIGLTSLKILSHCLTSLKAEKEYWQWVYISLHSAVQAYMVLALTGTHSLLTYSKTDMKEWLEKYDNHDQLPECHLDRFLNLYKKTKSTKFLFYDNSNRFIPSETQNSSIKLLNDRRNDFIHYKPAGYLIIMGDRPFSIVTDCLDYIEFLAFQSNNIIWFEEHYKTETERLLSECRSVIALSCSPR